MGWREIITKKSSISGNTPTIISRSICLIKEEFIDSTYHSSFDYSHKEKTIYTIMLLTKFSDGITKETPLTSQSTDEEMANKMFDFYVKSKGNLSIKEVVKESKIES